MKFSINLRNGMSESGFRSPETSCPLTVNPLNLKPELLEPEVLPCSWRERCRCAKLACMLLLLLLRLPCITRSSSVAGSMPNSSGNSSGNLCGRETKRQCTKHWVVRNEKGTRVRAGGRDAFVSGVHKGDGCSYERGCCECGRELDCSSLGMVLGQRGCDALC